MKLPSVWVRPLTCLFLVVLLIVCAIADSSDRPAIAAVRATPTPVTRNAAGDIPDTATYLRYRGHAYTIEYVEGWVQARLSGDGVRMSDIDSFERVTLQSRPRSSLTLFARGTGLAQARHEYGSVSVQSVTGVRLHSGSAVRLVFRARSAPDPVTSKRVTLVIDRYFVPGRTRLAVVTLATPAGVDNVDAFRRIAQSFTWTGR